MQKKAAFLSLEEAIQNKDKVVTLDISRNNLSKVPEEIIYLKNLRCLLLFENNISFIPPFFQELKSLEILDISANTIRNFPENILQLNNLKELYLHNNFISTIPSEIAQLHRLEILNLSFNQINIIPDSVKELKNIEHFRIGWNPLAEDELEKLKNLLPEYVKFH